ncbi:MAG: sodium:proton antiporter [Planctomycetes bacterium]|nr:sodium:proton antiporter [Planctomycetota bacterium]
MIAAYFTTASADPLPPVPAWAIGPFVILLLLIATGPLFFPKFWHRSYPAVALALGAVVAAYYFVARNHDGHGMHKFAHAAVEYAAFVSLIGSLYVVASTVLIQIRARGTTTANCCILGAGAILANLVGTTGASMLLIRPYLRINRGGFGARHLVFFIFIISNTGGALTPIGDPPLFLGFLKGVPFFWTVAHLALPWLLTNVYLILAFAIVDRFCARAAPAGPGADADPSGVSVKFENGRGLVYLIFILEFVLVQNTPVVKDLGATGVLLCSAAMCCTAALAWAKSEKRILLENEFSLAPVREVAFLFAGIFLTMIPALDYLQQNAVSFELRAPSNLYFATGVLSAVLDNAPTYLTFLTTELASAGVAIDDPAAVAAHVRDPAGAAGVGAISAAAVFFGAATYIGNGPNFMVKSIAESSGFKCPGFFAYLFRWSIPILLPVLALAAYVFYN